MRRIGKAILCVAMATYIAAPFAARAQAQGYPSKAVRIIVPHGAGGPADVPPRGIAQSLSQTLGQPFVIENRDGADGVIGAQACAKAAPDGYTICSTTSSVITMNPALRSDLIYDPPRDFSPIIYLGTVNDVLLVHPSLKTNSVRGLVELAKQKPNSITWGGLAGSGIGAMLAGWFKNSLGVSFFQVPYKNNVQSFQATVSGEVHAMAYIIGPAVGMIKSGKVIALAVTGAGRSPMLPDVPSMKELGYDIELSAWLGMFAPAGTPAEIINRLNTEISRLLSNSEFRAKFLTTQGIDADEQTGRPAPEFVRFLQIDRDNIAKVLTVSGMRP